MSARVICLSKGSYQYYGGRKAVTSLTTWMAGAARSIAEAFVAQGIDLAQLSPSFPDDKEVYRYICFYALSFVAKL